VPDVSPYFRDEEGPFDVEVRLRPDADLSLVRDALPDAVMLGEPVLRAREAATRRAIVEATIAALLAVAAGLLLLRGRGREGADREQRLLAMATPLALLGWSGLGVDAWTVPALVLAGTARGGVALLPGFALLLSPVLALQRIAVVLGTAGLLRLRPGAWTAGPPPPARAAWALAGFGALGVAVFLRVSPGEPGPVPPEPVAAFVANSERGSAASRFVQQTGVVGGERFADEPAAGRKARRLIRIFDLASRRAEDAEGAERARWEEIAVAASRDAVEVPRGLRARRETGDGRAVLWLDERVGPRQHSYRHYRADSRHTLRHGALLGAWFLFGIGALVRLARGGLSIRDGVAPLLAFAAAAWLLPRHGLAPALPVVAVAVFGAGWLAPVALAAVVFFLPVDAWAGVAAFAMAAAAAHPVSR